MPQKEIPKKQIKIVAEIELINKKRIKIMRHLKK
jgi:hypothetical protein